MKQLTIKEVAPYSPYGLKGKYENKIISMTGVYLNYVRGDYKGAYDYITYNQIKPILRPLSDLTKEIEHNGERFVPIDKIVEVILGYKHSELFREMSKERQDKYFNLLVKDINKSSIEYRVVQKLLQWHFDIFSLIENGLAVDYNNTINK